MQSSGLQAFLHLPVYLTNRLTQQALTDSIRTAAETNLTFSP